MSNRAARSRYYVVTNRGDSAYFDTEGDLNILLEIWKSKGRKEFYVFEKRGSNGK